MINVEEFRDLIREVVKDELGDRTQYKIAEIASVGDKVSVIFSGEPEPTQKEYTYLKSYHPQIGDRVWLAKDKGTYVVLGKIDQYDEPMSGQNENGHWIKFPDGTLFCYAEVEVTEPADISSNGMYRSETMTWWFPQEFVGGGFAWFESTSLNRWPQKTNSALNTSASFRLWRANSSSVLGTVHGFAIGKWK